MTTYTDRQKACIRDVLTSMECTAQWLENGCDPKEAAAEIRLAMSRLTVESTSPITGFSEPDGGVDVLTDERLTELAVDHLHIDYDRMPAGVVPLLRAAIALAGPSQPAAPADFQECAAQSGSCVYGPYGRHGESQCKYCGDAAPSTAAQGATDAKAHTMACDLQAEQTFLGSCYESCDDSGKARWKRLQRVIDHLTAPTPVADSAAAFKASIRKLYDTNGCPIINVDQAFRLGFAAAKPVSVSTTPSATAPAALTEGDVRDDDSYCRSCAGDKCTAGKNCVTIGRDAYRCGYCKDTGYLSDGHCQWCAVDVVDPFDVPAAPAVAPSDAGATFQARVQPWMLACFGAEIAADRIERNHRFFEEATEAVQANGMTRSEAHQLVDYTFDRPVGELHQEIGGVMVTLAALCLASGQDMHAAAETELMRIWTKVEAIRAKQAAKPKHSPLPQHIATAPAALTDEQRESLENAIHNFDRNGFRADAMNLRAILAAEPAALTDRNAVIEECCVAIKAEDDRKSAEDYMLDSDDCIRVIRALATPASDSATPNETGEAKS